jgi:hypothetical protein
MTELPVIPTVPTPAQPLPPPVAPPPFQPPVAAATMSPPPASGAPTAQPARPPLPAAVKPPQAGRPVASFRPSSAATPSPPPFQPLPSPAPSAPVKQLSPLLIRQIMLAAEPRFKSCLHEAWGTNISIGVTVDATGLVQKAEILGPLAQSQTGRCITDQVRKLHFPPFTEGGPSKPFFWSYQIPSSSVAAPGSPPTK